MRSDRADVTHDILVGKLDPFRLAGRARGIDDRMEIIESDRRRMKLTAVGQQFFEILSCSSRRSPAIRHKIHSLEAGS